MSSIAGTSVQIVRNPRALRSGYPAELRSIISLDEHRRARSVVEGWPAYRPTQLHDLSATAADLGLAKVWLKDESTRFGLGAFKSVGGAYAVFRQLENSDRKDITVACASAGNHGRAVAWGARQFGAHCVVYLYEGVSEGRRQAIEDLGAAVDASSPSYEHAVRRIAVDAERNGWFVISDTAYEGYTEIPKTVMQGYTVIAQEVLEQLETDRPTHVLLQAGVGGFAAAIAAHLWESLGADRPTVITVEPDGAACVQASLAAGRMVQLLRTYSIMGGLNCAVASTVAWEILRPATDWAAAIPDQATIQTMRALAKLGITAGESGAAGFAALQALCAEPHIRQLLGLNTQARVLLFSTEGATDPERYRQLIGFETSA